MMDIKQMFQLVLTCVVLGIAVGSDFDAGNTLQAQEFSEPRNVRIAGKRLDIQVRGGATPFAYDIDSDGVLDLLVGENYGGRLRVFPGKSADGLEYSDPYLFDEICADPRIPNNNPFTPVAADIDRDGLVDLLTPSWHGNISWFRRVDATQFEARKLVQCTNGREIDVEWTFSVGVLDWNGDSLEDLLVVTSSDRNGNRYFVFENSSVGETIAFRPAQPIDAAEGIPEELRNNTRLVVVDWDADGHQDLVFSCETSDLYVRRGTERSGEFHQAEKVQILPEGNEFKSIHRFSVVDLNADGKLDVIAGHDGARFKKQLDESEQHSLDALKEQHRSALQGWGRVYRSFSRLRDAGADSKALVSVRSQVMKENNRQLRLHSEIEAMQMETQWHSYVWYALQK